MLLHVESRGKVLTSLNDRIAGTLSTLRADFFEEELKPLVRRDAVQLAIDGFDELSDSRGYDRAWGALRDFIRDLRGKGTCILAGRDTMLDASSVREGLGNAVGDGSLDFLRLRHPQASEVRKWMARQPDWKDCSETLNLLEKRIEDSEYLRRPFFISKIADLGPDRFRDAQGEPIVEIIEGIVDREGPKLTGDSSDIDPELASRLYAKVLSEAARMMMDDETNEIEADWLGLFVEEEFGEHVSPEMVKALAQRAQALALMEEDAGDNRKRSFPHETVRSYFFAQNVFDYFPGHGATTGLYRVPLNADDFRIFNRVARSKSLEEQRRLREKMLAKLREPTGYDHLRSNLGGLLLSFAPLEEDEDGSDGDRLVLSHFEWGDVWMADLLGAQKVHLDNCAIHRLDVRGADLGRVRFSNARVSELLVDPYVRFGESVPDVHSLIVYEHFKGSRWLGQPREWIAKRRPPPRSTGSDPDKRLDLLYKFARVSMRQYAIRSQPDMNDPISGKIIGSPCWLDLRKLLEKHGRLEVDESPAASGPKSKWFHLVAGPEFLDPEQATRDTTRLILEELNAGSPVEG